MLQKFQNIFKIPELKRKIIFTLLIFVVYRIGGHVPDLRRPVRSRVDDGNLLVREDRIGTPLRVDPASPPHIV